VDPVLLETAEAVALVNGALEVRKHGKECGRAVESLPTLRAHA
jgi:hypothetical protein